MLLQSVQRKRVLLAERFRPQVPREFTCLEQPVMGRDDRFKVIEPSLDAFQSAPGISAG